jgi:putative tryptophan/tyrosine transport system substrate-binding protein
MRLIGFAVVLALTIAVFAAEAQQTSKVYRIGFVSMRSGPGDNPQLEAFRQGLQAMGYQEGRNAVLEIRYAAGDPAKLPDLVAEIVRLKVEVIVTQSGIAAIAAKKATQTIPIVMASSGDAVRLGLVASLARPGGNVTGLTMISPELSQKRLEILREMLPALSRVGVLWCGPGVGVGDTEWTQTQAAASVLKVQLASLEVRGGQDLASAFALAARQRFEAVIVLDCSQLNSNAARIAEFALENRMPALYPFSIYPEAGGLMSYGPDLREGARRSAYFVDKILKGAKPTDLPVEQPTKFELVINLKTAKALGLTIPPSVLGRADQVIE